LKDNQDIKLAKGIRLGRGWFDRESDGIKPFRWTSSTASITININGSLPRYLTMLAGSPRFGEKKNIILEHSGHRVVKEIAPLWSFYTFFLDPSNNIADDTRFMNHEIKITVTPPLSVENDSRDLGIMVREIGVSRHKSCVHCRTTSLFHKKDAPSILWLASYPRSGNTWARFLLTQLLFKKLANSNEIHRYIPEVDSVGEVENALEFGGGVFEAFNGEKVIIVKSRYPYSQRMPLISCTAGAIYILRNPLDVTASIAQFRTVMSTKEEILRRFSSEDQAVADCIQSTTTYGGWGELSGSWHGHVFSWLEVARQQDRFPILLVKYEDLKQNPHSQAERILEFLGLPVDMNKISMAVEASSLASIKEMQEREITLRQPGLFWNPDRRGQITSGKRFIYKGETGTGKKTLTHKQQEAAHDLFGNIMKKFGYL